LLARGVRFGTYEVLELLGSGGVGEVFRAHDSRLRRDVAVKVLSERFRLDAQRLRRFEHEARVLASLNHPNIATLHAIEPLGETQALILEFVDGETLAERIAAGPLPLPDALAIAHQIVAALEAAHEQGVVHRDLKPANIKLRSDGTVKVLDFGLAQVSASALSGIDPRAITLTAVDLVIAGTVMGTPAYMSPEQARGLPVDKRTDIWAFACVLYEMLTGRAAFGGEHVSDVVARVIEREPDLAALPDDVPPGVRRLLRRCFQKDPRERLRDIGDARLDLEESSTSVDEAKMPTGRRTWGWRARVAAVVIALGIGLVIALTATDLALRMRTQPVPAVSAPPPVARFAIPVAITASPSGRALAISADGSRIAVVTDRGLAVRTRDQLDTLQLSGLSAPGAGAPFFSPDGQWIAFTDGQSLKKVPSTSGPVVQIAESGPAAVASWSDGGIVFADMNGLFHIATEGSAPRALQAGLGANEQAMFPQLLPGNKAVLFTVIPTRTNTPGFLANAQGARVDVVNLATGARHTVLQGAGRAQYLPTGHLVYVAGETLYAAPFDAERLELRGAVTPVLKGVNVSEFAVSDEGTLVYVSRTAGPGNTLVWVDRQGREQALDAPARPYNYPRLSPDGTRVALDVNGPPDRDIWIWDLKRKTYERFTLDPAGNPIVEWSRDGHRLAFGSERFGVTNMFWQAADGSGEPEQLLKSDRLQMPLAFTPEGRLLFSADVAGHGRDIHALSLDGSHRVERIVYSEANDLTANVSPDGHWIVYDSDESGQFEVYVRPYPQAYSGGRWQISSNGGRQPLWSYDGREIFYRDFEGGMYAAAVNLNPTFAPGPVARLFPNAGYAGGGARGGGRTYDVTHDGHRFLMIKVERAPAAPASAVVVVLNWFEELKRAVP
jgi:eukaryotic-like serine/threonine-protein kinase